jgi:hypothetical protein
MMGKGRKILGKRAKTNQVKYRLFISILHFFNLPVNQTHNSAIKAFRGFVTHKV